MFIAQCSINSFQSEQMREDIRDYQRQVEAQRESMLAKRDEDFEVRDKISGKNKLINMALEENRVSCHPSANSQMHFLF